MKVLQFPSPPPLPGPRAGGAGSARPGRLVASIDACLESYRAEQVRLRDEGVRLQAAVERLRRQTRRFSRARARLTREIDRLRRCAVRPASPPRRD
jgi:hypothetical protein